VPRSGQGAPVNLLDVVRLRVASGDVEAGAIGTIVEAFDEGAMVEITDDEGRTVAVLPLPYEALERLDVPEQGKLPV
jgi:hypothetical protein